MSDLRNTSSIFTRGAVDLSALRNAAQTPARPTPPSGSAPAASGGTPSPAPGAAAPGGVAVIDVSEATFQSEVLERSLATPVLVDFWADWCGPCKQLSPMLERLAVEGGGAWVLAKVDVDANPRLAQAFQIQSIPMVYAVIGGQVTPLFAGVQPEAQIRQLIGEVLRVAGVEVSAPEDPRLAEADTALMDGDLDAAEHAYKKILAETPGDSAAEAGLAQVMLSRRVSGVDAAAALGKADSAPDDLAAQLLAADIEVLSGRAEQAYDRLIALVRRTAGDEREKAREHLVSLFAVAGPDDPAVAKARRSLASALF
ncbi:MAG TPA: tetratricopeptide repeat protein [Micromonosporaceae bacterium]|nr:tetratricopeptide repeat protein [Micromonosporaceae bacterium]